MLRCVGALDLGNGVGDEDGWPHEAARGLGREAAISGTLVLTGISGRLALLFPSSFLVGQVLSNQDSVFLRIANDRGWTYAHNPGDKNSVLFEKISGEVAEDQ